jgi:hypothetical protein
MAGHQGPCGAGLIIMSLRINYVIHATDPEWVFTPEQIGSILDFLQAQSGKGYKYWEGDKITFLDCGEGFDTVRCNLCRREIDAEVWGNAMQIAFSRRFAKLDCFTPCCKGASSLNNLIYNAEQGFARNYFVGNQDDSTEPIEPLQKAQIQALSASVALPLKFIHAHY